MNPQIAAGALRPHAPWEGPARPCSGRIPEDGAFEPTFRAQRGGA